MTHLRCQKGKKDEKVSFYMDMKKMLGEHLHHSGWQVFHAKSDADLLIVLKAVESAETTKIVLIGEDTDLMVLLLYHTKSHGFDLYFAPELKKNSKC